MSHPSPLLGPAIADFVSATPASLFAVDVLADDVFRFVALNDRYTRLTGVSDAAGRLLDDVYPRDRREHIRDLLKRCSASCVEVVFDDHIELPSGDRAWRTTLSPLTDRSGRCRRVLGAATDLTSLREVEDKLTRLVVTDELTGAKNRAHFFDAGSVERDRATRHRTALSVIRVDLDAFEVVNEEFGHATGDLVLRQTHEACVRSVRHHDIIARVDGEEFAALLPHTPQEGAVLVGERIRRTVEQLRVHTPLGRVEFTASLGVATLGQNESFEELYARAGDALNEAKDLGKNRLEVSQFSPVRVSSSGSAA